MTQIAEPASGARSRGHHAKTPTDIPARGWKEILWRVKSEIAQDHVSVVAAGVAFYALIAIFPAIAALISISGLILDPADLTQQLDRLVTVLPESAATIIQDQIVKVTGGDQAANGFMAAFGILVALYGAMKGVLTLMDGLNIAYDEDEKRSFLGLYLTALALTLFLLLGLLIAIGLVVVLPSLTAFLTLPPWIDTLIAWSIWPLLVVFAALGLSVIYRFGPSRADPRWRWVSLGAIIAVLVWVAGTIAFSIYVRNFGSYTETYGALGGVIILLTWLWLSAFVVLAGAELNAEMEHQTMRDTTTGAPEPMGQRGAVKADTRPASPGDDTSGDGRRHGLSERGGKARDGASRDRRPDLPPATELSLALALAARAVWTMARGRPPLAAVNKDQGMKPTDASDRSV